MEEKTEEKTDLGKFKSVEALLHAYGELEAEFTRRSQRLKALEEREGGPEESKEADEPKTGGQPSAPSLPEEELYRAVMDNEGVRARVLSDYLRSLKGVPLMTGAGTGVAAPVARPRSIAEAGSLALGYLKSKK